MAGLLDVGVIDEPVERYLAATCTIVRTFGDREDSKALIVGVEHQGRRFVVKGSSDPAGAVWLAKAREVHARIKHREIVPLLHAFAIPDGLALVDPWAPGEVLVDDYDESVPARDAPGSPHHRFLGLPLQQILEAIRSIVDAHVAVAAAGFVAVDLYEGCVIYDFDAQQVHLIDLDHYQPGPYVLAHDRQLGSRSFMAPEEFERGAVIDERTTVYTLGRLALVFLGCARRSDPDRSAFRGPDELFDVLLRATSQRTGDRFETVLDLRGAWDDAFAS
ncbi:MAG TPA: hypothetical protein VMY34_08985 [Acidimicrobiales bacterium]|nr:hypothetical protein [Acidimicrobiales bacterium]